MILQKTENWNGAKDANDTKPGIWYRAISKIASLPSRKATVGGLGPAPEGGLDIQTLCLQNTSALKRAGNQSRRAYKFAHSPEWITSDSSKTLDSKKRISSDSLCNLKSFCVTKRKIVWVWTIKWTRPDAFWKKKVCLRQDTFEVGLRGVPLCNSRVIAENGEERQKIMSAMQRDHQNMDSIIKICITPLNGRIIYKLSCLKTVHFLAPVFVL